MRSTSIDLSRFREERYLERFLGGLGVDSPERLDLIAIAAAFGAAVLFDRLHNRDAQVVRSGESSLLIVDSAAPAYRQRFSIAHEIAHLVLHRDAPPFRCRLESAYARTASNRFEREANRFAARLLLPDYLVLPTLDHSKPYFVQAFATAARFNVSLTTAAIRRVEIANKPLMFARYASGGRTWTRVNRRFPAGFRPRIHLHRHTAGFLVFEKRLKATGPMLVPAKYWFAHKAAPYFTVLEEAVYRDGVVMSVLEWIGSRDPDEALKAFDDRTGTVIDFMYPLGPRIVHSFERQAVPNLVIDAPGHTTNGK